MRLMGLIGHKSHESHESHPHHPKKSACHHGHITTPGQRSDEPANGRSGERANWNFGPLPTASFGRRRTFMSRSFAAKALHAAYRRIAVSPCRRVASPTPPRSVARPPLSARRLALPPARHLSPESASRSDRRSAQTSAYPAWRNLPGR